MMNPGTLLHALRKGGYALSMEGDDLVIERDTPPPDEVKTMEMLAQARGALAALLAAEQTRTVQEAMKWFPNARVTAVLAPGEVLEAPFTPGPALKGEPMGWTSVKDWKLTPERREAAAARRYIEYLKSIGATVFEDPIGLVLIAPRELFSTYLAAGLRIYRKQVAAVAWGEPRDERADEGWLRV